MIGTCPPGEHWVTIIVLVGRVPIPTNVCTTDVDLPWPVVLGVITAISFTAIAIIFAIIALIRRYTP
jgi:hypothetical protein